MLTGSLQELEQLPEEILKEDIYDETGHVDTEFMMGILDYMSKSADIAVRVQEARFLQTLLFFVRVKIKTVLKNGKCQRECSQFPTGQEIQGQALTFFPLLFVTANIKTNCLTICNNMNSR